MNKARQLVRTLEAATQALYDDGAIVFMAVQALGFAMLSLKHDRAAYVSTIETVAPTIRSNYVLIAQTLESLLAVGHDQSSISQGEYRKSIQWRTSRIHIADSSPATVPTRAGSAPANDDVVNVEATPPGPKTQTAPIVESTASGSTRYNSRTNLPPSPLSQGASALSRSDSMSETDVNEKTLIEPSSPETASPLDEGLIAFVDEDDREHLILIVEF